MILDFTTTATYRPKILDQTYASFLPKLKGYDREQSTLYINIDPPPLGTIGWGKAEDVLNVARKYFTNIVSNCPRYASFPAAVKWCFSQSTKHYLFHLEDDWVLSQEVDLNNLKKLFNGRRELACVNLRAYRITDNRICLSPGLWSAHIAKIIADRLVTAGNPERQLRPATAENPLGGRDKGFVGVQYPADLTSLIIKDIGRDWLQRVSGVQKYKGVNFTEWTKGLRLKTIR